MIGVLKEIKVIKQRVMEATVLRKIFFKERTSGRRPVDEDSAKCVVWGKPGEELPRQREQPVPKSGFPEAQEQEQGAWVSVNREERWGSRRACHWGRGVCGASGGLRR